MNENGAFALMAGALIVVVAMFSIFGKGVTRHRVGDELSAAAYAPPVGRGLN